MALIGIYQYGDLYKINWYRCGNGLKEDKYYIDAEEEKEKEYNSDEKLKNNIARAKNKVIEYGHCNDWQYFATFTIDSKKQNRFDLNSYHCALGNWIGNYNKKYNTSLKYIAIPEQHKNGAWHEHALLSGVKEDSLTINSNGYLDMPYYQNRFGYVSLSPIRDKTKTVFYITKYLSKDMSKRIKEIGAHLYYSSQGLKTKECVYIGNLDIKDDALKREMWCNDYIGIQWTDSIPTYIYDKMMQL